MIRPAHEPCPVRRHAPPRSVYPDLLVGTLAGGACAACYALILLAAWLMEAP